MSKSAGKFKLKFLKSQKVWEIQIEIPQMLKSAETLNSPNPVVASITISHIFGALWGIGYSLLFRSFTQQKA